MINVFKQKNVTWIDLESPTKEEVRKVAEEWKVNPAIAQELLIPTLRPKVDLYHDFIYLVLHFPAIRHSHLDNSSQEIDFIIGRNFIITTHYDTVDPLHEFSKLFEVNSILNRVDMTEHAGYVFYFMMDNIYKGMQNELENIKSKISSVEADIFKGKETEMVTEISKLSRNLIDIKRDIRSHDSVLKSLEIAAEKFFGKDLEFHLKHLLGEYEKIRSELEGFSELLGDLRDTNDSLVSTKQNEVMKNLAAIAFIALPVGLFVTLLQIDTFTRPLVGKPGDFWAILIIITVLIGILYQYSKSKKWL